MIYAWNHFLYQPLLNALIYLYENYAGNNFGWAVVELTVLLRVALLPLSILSERNAARYERLERRIELITREAGGDSVARRERIREMLRRERVSPWAKVASFGFQALVLVLLYQVFLGGMNYEKFSALYPWMRVPDYLNLDFFGFNVGTRYWIWPAVVAVILFLEITWSYRGRKDLTRSDQLYRVVFPLMSLGALALLPMVKSVFILTSMLFGFFLSLLRRITYHPAPEPSSGPDVDA